MNFSKVLTIIKVLALTFIIFWIDFIVRSIAINLMFNYPAYPWFPYKFWFVYLFGVIIYVLFKRTYKPNFGISIAGGFVISYAFYVLLNIREDEPFDEYVRTAVIAVFLTFSLHLLYKLFFERRKQALPPA